MQAQVRLGGCVLQAKSIRHQPFLPLCSKTISINCTSFPQVSQSDAALRRHVTYKSTTVSLPSRPRGSIQCRAEESASKSGSAAAKIDLLTCE